MNKRKSVFGTRHSVLFESILCYAGHRDDVNITFIM